MINILKLFLALLFFLPGVSISTELNVDKSKKNSVKFISDAPIEDFEGFTDKIDGYIFWEGENFTEKSDVYFEVDLRTLDTGIGLRNRHMRENYLHTDKYPLAQFSGKIISAEQITENQFKVNVEGEMKIHGVTNKLKTAVKMNKTSNGYNIKTNFEVKLSDYNIDIPKLMFMKINEVMKLELDFYTSEK